MISEQVDLLTEADIGAESKEGKKSWDAGPQSSEIQALNKEFGQIHGISALVNMFGMGFMIIYGFTIGLKL